jgi:hypothetical protein
MRCSNGVSGWELLDGFFEEGVPGFGVFVLQDEELVGVEAVFQGVA